MAPQAQPDYGEELVYDDGTRVPRVDSPPDPDPLVLTYDDIPAFPTKEPSIQQDGPEAEPGS